jgi:polysaccharide biosynthesis protein PslG
MLKRLTIPTLALLAAVLAVGHLLVALALARPEAPERPRVVETRNPKIGIHTRLTDEGTTERIARTYQMVRQMGAAWVVEYVPWPYVQGDHPDLYTWAHADRLVDRAIMEGLRVVIRLDAVPAWARPPGTTFKYLDPDRYGAFAAFAAAFASRYRGRVSHLIIWNEPNLSYEWGQRPVDAAAYTRLLAVTHEAVKRANPAMQVVAAGLAPTTEPPGSQWGLDDLLYLRQMYQAGAAPYFDVLALHAYGLTESPDAPPDPARITFSRALLSRQIMEEFGDGAKPAILTEGGWNDSPRWQYGVSPADRIAHTLRAYELATTWPWLEAMCLWTFRTPRASRTYHDHYAFVTPDFIPKPIYLEVQLAARGRVPDPDEP